MKTLKLKKIGEFDFREVLLGLLQNAPVRGYTASDVMKAVKAIAAIEAAVEEVKFEDDIWEFVKKAVNEASYRIASKELAVFLGEFE